MSYDLFAQAFVQGEAANAPRSAAAVLDVIRPYAVIGGGVEGVWHTRTPDGGEADLYVNSDRGGFMVNHFSLGETTKLIVSGDVRWSRPPGARSAGPTDRCRADPASAGRPGLSSTLSGAHRIRG